VYESITPAVKLMLGICQVSSLDVYLNDVERADHSRWAAHRSVYTFSLLASFNKTAGRS
jgi:hypothetical protein